MNLAELDGKPFTVWLIDDHDESAVFSGVARWDGSTLVVDRSPKPFEIRPEWYERIQHVPTEEARTILLGADYVICLHVGTLPDGPVPPEYEPLGLKWPESVDE